jgi:hypothetical protein
LAMASAAISPPRRPRRDASGRASSDEVVVDFATALTRRRDAGRSWAQQHGGI